MESRNAITRALWATGAALSDTARAAKHLRSCSARVTNTNQRPMAILYFVQPARLLREKGKLIMLPFVRSNPSCVNSMYTLTLEAISKVPLNSQNFFSILKTRRKMMNFGRKWRKGQIDSLVELPAKMKFNSSEGLCLKMSCTITSTWKSWVSNTSCFIIRQIAQRTSRSLS